MASSSGHSTWTWDAPVVPQPPRTSAFERLWRGFMTARIGVGLVLLILLGGMRLLGMVQVSDWQLALCGGYLAASLAVRFFGRPVAPGRTFDPQWVYIVGVDLLAFSVLHFLQAANLNFSPLYALPVLTASVLGSMLLGLGTAAAATLLLLVHASLQALDPDHTARIVQAGLTGCGYFVAALLANELATRLAREEEAARRSLSAARTQAHVNELVIETLTDGLLVVGPDWRIHAANPAARNLLAWQAPEAPASLALVSRPGWRPLAAIAQRTFSSQQAQSAELALELTAGERLHLRVRTRLTAAQDPYSDALCVMFLQDLREAEAQVRTEKLAAMGRMSAAVAHEIRNPLAAIAQANALLAEELSEPGQRQLSDLVGKNTHRLSQIVEEILNLVRVQQQPVADWLELDQSVAGFVGEWERQAQAGERLQTLLQSGTAWVTFDGEHLRRVVVNLLDNALRYASRGPGAILVATAMGSTRARLQVWSDGAPLDASVQRHLFEPFFSSESRSSGLGLYICRELCERHGATVAYTRVRAPDGSSRDGNAFTVTFRTRASMVPGGTPFDTIGA
ncbi:sensor histidine kinase [Ramlibacter alkalitolerans]|uniref:histidine kinase n=1 Tax=Ramlibacter alkalitolerans TaxID=2039631 RepID=A0ABS1JSV7_9BURK|nr:ATP-binding protein [Ramlibacter alkalitolerans]MBL0427343.1 PAS domain-containing sensor histidine kinase [Ramlibacter alkalitolerans]